MSEIKIREVSGKRGTEEFVEVVWKICDQKKFPAWVPPLRLSVIESLDTKKNPFYRRAEIQLFIAEKDGAPVGRIAAVDNRGHNEFHGEKTGFYGFFECINDQEVANHLFRTAEAWLKARGLDKMVGPVNPSTNHECGLLIEGTDQHPTVMTTWNPDYYAPLHEGFGLSKAKDLVAYRIEREKNAGLPPKVVKYVQRLRERNSRITFRDFNLKDYKNEVDRCFEIYNSAWENNWGFFPMTREEFEFAAKDMKMILDPRMAFIAEVDGKPAGFMLAVPDLNLVLKRIPDGKLLPTGIFKLLFGKKHMNKVRIVTLGVKPEFRGSGIFALFTFEAFDRAHRYGYSEGEASWILEDNVAMNKPWADLGAPRHRRWRIYEKSLA